MDYIREILNMGGNIKDTVNDAIDRDDYEGLAKHIAEQMAQFTRAATQDFRGRTSYKTVYNPDGSRTTYKTTYGPTGQTTTQTTYKTGGQKGARFQGTWPQDIDLGTRGKAQWQSRPQGQYQQRPQGQYQQRPQGTNNSAFWGGKNTSNAQNAAGQNQNAQSAAGKFTGQQTGSGYNAGQAYDERRKQQNASWNYSSPQSRSTALTPFNQYKSKAGSGLLKQTAGVTGLFITVPVAVGSIIAAAAAATPAAIAGAAIWGLGAGVSGYFTAKGSKQRKLTKTFDKYSKIIGTKEYTTLEELAESSGETIDMVNENINDMIDIGLLPQAKFDAKKTTLMLTKNAYDQYLLAEESRANREKEEAELDAQVGSAEARKIITEGEGFVVKLKTANDLIPGKEMTDKLDQMERIVSKIINQVKKDPASAEDLRKFMNYYLPTTERLLNAYIELDKQPEVGDNIKNTKREIEESVDIINNAFENLLDSLFQDVAWDVSADISVMKTMMEQDGLTKKKHFEEAVETSIAEDPTEEVPVEEQAPVDAPIDNEEENN